MQTVTTATDLASYSDQIAKITINIALGLTIMARTAPEDLQPFLIGFAAAAENAADKAHIITEMTL